MPRISNSALPPGDPAPLGNKVDALLAELAEINKLVRRKALTGETTLELRSRRAEIERLVAEVGDAADDADGSREHATAKAISELTESFIGAAESVVADRMKLLEIPEMSK